MFVLKCEWLKYVFDLTQKYFVFNANLTWNKKKTYICIRVYICCAFTWPKIHTCKKYIYANANIHLVWAGVYLHGGVYLHMCKLTFTYMQLRSHAQKYTRVQIIHICIICTPCVNQRMWTGFMKGVCTSCFFIKLSFDTFFSVTKVCQNYRISFVHLIQGQYLEQYAGNPYA